MTSRNNLAISRIIVHSKISRTLLASTTAHSRSMTTYSTSSMVERSSQKKNSDARRVCVAQSLAVIFNFSLPTNTVCLWCLRLNSLLLVNYSYRKARFQSLAINSLTQMLKSQLNVSTLKKTSPIKKSQGPDDLGEGWP